MCNCYRCGGRVAKGEGHKQSPRMIFHTHCWGLFRKEEEKEALKGVESDLIKLYKLEKF